MTTKLTRSRFLLLMVLVAALGLGGRIACTDSDEPGGEGLTKVRLAVSPFQDTLLPIVGKELGWYEEAGLDVDIVILGWTEVQEAIAAKSVDVGINNISSVIATHHNAPELVYAYGMNTFDNGFALMVRPDGPFKTLEQLERELGDREAAIRAAAAQLKGKAVVTTSGTDMEQGVAAAARRGGLDFSEVRILNLAPDEGLAAFLAGSGDAYIGGVPQRTRAGKEGMLELLSGADFGPPPINGFVTTASYFDSNKETLVSLLNIWFRTVAYIDSREGEPGRTGAEIIIKALNENSGASFTLEDFWLFWNKLEHYPPTPAAVHAEILSEDGSNYWKRRWDDCNSYFHDVVHRIPEKVTPEGVFRMLELQEELQ